MRACGWVRVYICNHHLSNDLQSAYKRFHSTETALLKIHNDIVDNMDNGKVTALTLLDQLLSIQLIIQSFYNASIGILEFLAQLFGGSNHFYQTDIKVLTYLAHYLAHNIYHLECHKDPYLALFCSAYILHRSAKLLLIVISVITFMLMTHRFTYHFHNQMYKYLFRL